MQGSEDRIPEQEQEKLAGEVNDSLGEPAENAEEINETPAESKGFDDPLYVQKRLKRQERAHAREMREMQARMDQLQQSLAGDNQRVGADQYAAGGEDTIESGNVNDAINQAVQRALQAKDANERQQQEAQKYQHVQKQYQNLSDHLDSLGDKYDDFDDVVRSRDVPFTDAIRDASLMLPMNGKGSAGETLYKLGKNRSELERISKLHPLDQAKEVVKLSMALMNGQDGGDKQQPRSLGQIKSNPVSSSNGINESTSIGEIRKQLKNQGWNTRPRR